MTQKLAIVSTHPIQYNAPLFRLLQQRGRIAVHVFYTWGDSMLTEKYDPGFGKNNQWDIPLLDGYDYEFLENTATDKGTHHFNGIDNPGIIPALTAYDPDAILVYGWSFKSHLRVLRHFHGKKPVLFRGDSTLLDHKQFSVRSLLRRMALFWIYRHIDKALYVGYNNREYFSWAGLSKDQLIYAPHAIENQRFYPSETLKEEADRLRGRLGIPADAFVFLFAGKLESKKDPLLLVDAFVHSGLQASAHLVIVGDGELSGQLKERTKNFATIHFLEFQNQSKILAVYVMCDVFVLPSQGPEETWGLVINESMAAGRPVVASDKCGGAVDLIRNDENGYIFRAGNMTSLQLTLQRIFNKRNELPEMGVKSLEMIADFGLENTALAIEKTVTSLPKAKKAKLQ